MNVKTPTEKEIFNIARNIQDDAARREYFEQVCNDDQELISRVQLLLQMQSEEPSFLESLDMETSGYQESSEVPGDTIGPYKLLEVIGEGGMGTVYMAEQTEPVKRRVALKVIKTGMDTRQVIARFEAERQALAVMDHANIAKVLDAGATDAGRPYFVMELVKGTSITKFCDEQQLDTESRLKLFQQVCHAVQHAHQKGVIHRDLKPANIMVAMYDDQPVPKIIDFGVAKATGDQLTEKTLFTRFGQVIGTLPYMSPEQAQFNQKDIDTRSDIYSLGAVLCELLSGQPPFDQEQLKSQALDETLRMIREDEPTKPSTKLSGAVQAVQIASSRKSSTEKLGSILRGDLDWIVMKALEKDRSRRYSTANELASDIHRYLENEPVHAGSPTAAYRFKKFAKRNRGKLIIGSAVFSSLLIACAALAYSTINGWYQQQRTQKALADARQGQERLEGLSEFIITGLLTAAAPNGIGNPSITIQDAMVALEPSINSRLPDTPEVKIWVMGRLGEYLSVLGRFENASRVLTEAYNRSKEIHGERDEETLYVGRHLAWALSQLDQHDDAVPLARRVAELATNEYGDIAGVANCWNTLGSALRRAGRLQESEQAFRKSIAIYERIGAPCGGPIANLGDISLERREFDEAERYYLDALELQRKNLGEDHIDTMNVLDDLALLYHSLGDSEKAKARLETLLERKQKFLSNNHPSTLRTMDMLAQVEYRLGNYERSLALVDSSTTGLGITFGESSMRYARSLHNLAIARRGAKDLMGAYEACEKAVAIATNKLGEQHSDTMHYMFTQWSYLRDLRRFDEALECAEKVIAFRKKQVEADPEDNSETMLAAAYLYLGILWHWQGEDDKALEPYNRAVDLLSELVKTDTHFQVRAYFFNSLRWRSTSLRHLGQFADSIADAELARTYADSLREQLDCDLRRAQCTAQKGQYSEAIDMTEDVLKELGDDGWLLTQAAAVYAVCSREIVSHVSASDQDASLASQFVERSLELLKQAAKQGEFGEPFNHIELQGNPDFKSLSHDQRFQEFLSTIKPDSTKPHVIDEEKTQYQK